MVNFCGVYGCGNRGNRDKKSFYRLPAIITREGQKTKELSQRRREKWLSHISRKIKPSNFPYFRVCSDHFLSGKPSALYDWTSVDWAPTLNMGHSKIRINVPLAAARTARVKKRNLEKKRQEEAEALLSFHRSVCEEGNSTSGTLEPHPEQPACLLLDRSKGDVMDRQMFSRRFNRRRRKHYTPGKRSGEEVEMMKQEVVEVIVQEAGQMEQEVEVVVEQEVEERGETAAEHSVEWCELCEPRRDEINRLLEENRRLRGELDEHRMTERFLKDNDDGKVKYYTGLPSSAAFQVLLCHVTPFLPQERRKLTPFQMILLTLMRLRLDLPLLHMTHLFGVHRGTIDRMFQSTVSVLYSRLVPLVHWPDRESLTLSMPDQFLEVFGNQVAAIVDCFEVSIERPSNLQARAQTFSRSKQGHTLKYLISITPQGAISFISKGWGGGVTDQQIIHHCGFLDKLQEGDVVLADRRFGSEETVGAACGELKIAAFTKAQNQLHALDVEEARRTAHLRLHVERVINLVCKKYTLLSSKVPIRMVLPCQDEDVTFLDKVVAVCCALINMCPTVVH